MAHKKLKQSATELRKKGFSLQEISSVLGISKSTSSLWLRKIKLSEKAQKRLSDRQIAGRSKALQTKKLNRESQLQNFQKEASHTLMSIPNSKPINKLHAALLWWCEGNKTQTYVKFTNSDESLVKNFLSSLRSGFLLNEAKFRVLVHIHDYHDDNQQKQYWSKVTNIPLRQFNRSYRKPNTGKRKHKNYQGCIALTYYDSKIAKELFAIYNAYYLKQPRGVR